VWSDKVETQETSIKEWTLKRGFHVVRRHRRTSDYEKPTLKEGTGILTAIDVGLEATAGDASHIMPAKHD
jgi:hypothetical protein